MKKYPLTLQESVVEIDKNINSIIDIIMELKPFKFILNLLNRWLS